jgi:hypothetical protein
VERLLLVLVGQLSIDQRGLVGLQGGLACALWSDCWLASYVACALATSACAAATVAAEEVCAAARLFCALSSVV